MDDRLRTDPDAPAIDTTRRRSSPWWVQLLTTVLIIIIAVYAAAWFNPGLRAQIIGWGVPLPLLPADAPAADAPAAPGGGQRPGGAPGGFPGAAPGAPGGGPGGAFGGGRQAVLVVALPAGTATINDRLTAIGEGGAVRTATIATASNGTLQSLEVAAGDWVEAGQPVARLDAATEEIALDRARLAADDAQAALARANELSASISAVQLAAASLTAETAALELRNAELALSRRTIVSPIAGRVGLLQVSPGNLVNAGTVVTTVEDSSEILIDFWVPERYAADMVTGLEVSAVSAAVPGQTFVGSISAVDNRIDAASRTLRVQARIPNEDGRIRPGMSFSVSMRFAGETYVTVDPLAIQWSAEGAYVWRVADGAAQRAMVQIVQRNSGGVLVTGEVAKGDLVVTEGVLQLQPGTAVRFADDAPARGG